MKRAKNAGIRYTRSHDQTIHHHRREIIMTEQEKNKETHRWLDLFEIMVKDAAQKSTEVSGMRRELPDAIKRFKKTCKPGD